MARSERARAKDRANEAFSLFIRTRDAIETTGDVEQFVCITCNRTVQLKGNDCGHFIPGRSDAVLYEEHNAHGQCHRCNVYGSGMWVEYEEAMIEKYGEKEVQRLKDLKNVIYKMKAYEFREVASEYKYKLKKLMEKL